MRNIWSEQELELLDKLFDQYPLIEVVNQYQKKAKKLKLPCRTDKSIKRKISRVYGCSKKIIRLSNMAVKDLAIILGVDRSRIHNWIKSDKIIVTKITEKLVMIAIKDVIDMARKYPYLLADITRDRLMYLFDNDAELVEYVLSYKWRRNGSLKKVRNRITGKIFNSIKEAAQTYYYSQKRMGKIINHSPDWEYL